MADPLGSNLNPYPTLLEATQDVRLFNPACSRRIHLRNNPSTPPGTMSAPNLVIDDEDGTGRLNIEQDSLFVSPGTTLNDLRIDSNYTGRVSQQSGSFPTDISPTGLAPNGYITSRNVHLRNMQMYAYSPGTWRDCLFGNAGWRSPNDPQHWGHGHSIYQKNLLDSPDLSLFDTCLVMPSMNTSVRFAGNGDDPFKHLLFKNTIFGGGQVGLVDTGNPDADDITIDGCMFLRSGLRAGLMGGVWERGLHHGGTLTIKNSVFYSSPQAYAYAMLFGGTFDHYVFTDNTIIYPYLIDLSFYTDDAIEWDRNTWYNPVGSFFAQARYDNATNLSAMVSSFASAWQARGFDVNGSITYGKPVSPIVNVYECHPDTKTSVHHKLAHVGFYDPNGSDSITIDIGDLASNGATLDVINAYNEDEIVQAVVSSGSITVPTTPDIFTHKKPYGYTGEFGGHLDNRPYIPDATWNQKHGVFILRLHQN